MFNAPSITGMTSPPRARPGRAVSDVAGRGNNVVDTYWSTPVDDPYRFLDSTKDPAVLAWMKAQANATDAILAKLPVRAELRKRIAEIDDAVPTVVTSVVRASSGRWFYPRRNAGENQFKLVRRDNPTGDDFIPVDRDCGATGGGVKSAVCTSPGIGT